MNPPDTRIPVTVLTGFLGAGKTTLLNRILSEPHGLKIAVIENEFGEIGIDHELVVNADEEIFEMNNGCICCTVRGDLIRILGDLLKRRTKFDYVLVETTGLADPGPVAQTFFADEAMRAGFRLDGIVTLVDAKHVALHLDESEECQQQIAFADRILLNKTDLVSAADLDALERRIQGMNRMAAVFRCQNADVPVQNVIGLGAFDLDARLKVDTDFLQEEAPFEWSGEWSLPAGEHILVFQPGPDPMMELVALPLAGDPEAARIRTLRQATALHGADPLVVLPGGLFRPGMERVELRFNAAGESRFRLWLDEPAVVRCFTQHHPDEFAMTLQVGDALVSPVATQTHASHHHDSAVSSVGLRETEALDPERLNAWFEQLLQEKGADIFRMKGILYVRGRAERIIFQGVHMMFGGKADRPWKPGETRASQIIFIGRNLDREALTRGFRSCIAR